jgi:hypothetical protein
MVETIGGMRLRRPTCLLRSNVLPCPHMAADGAVEENEHRMTPSRVEGQVR